MPRSSLIADLHRAARSGETRTLLALLGIKGANVVCCNAENSTLLHSASETGQLECVCILLDEDAPVNLKDHKGKTPLIKAAESSHPRVVYELLDAAADVTIADNEGITALHFSARHGDIVAMEALLKKGADINATTKTGLSPLHWAVASSKENSTMFLLQNGANLNTVDCSGVTPLHAAVYVNNQLSHLLLACGADASAVDHEGRTVSDLAAARGDSHLVQVLKMLDNRLNLDVVKGETKQFLEKLGCQLDRLVGKTQEEGQLRRVYEMELQMMLKAHSLSKDGEIMELQQRLMKLKSLCESPSSVIKSETERCNGCTKEV